jgi:hypothetical protein
MSRVLYCPGRFISSDHRMEESRPSTRSKPRNASWSRSLFRTSAQTIVNLRELTRRDLGLLVSIRYCTQLLYLLNLPIIMKRYVPLRTSSDVPIVGTLATPLKVSDST